MIAERFELSGLTLPKDLPDVTLTGTAGGASTTIQSLFAARAADETLGATRRNVELGMVSDLALLSAEQRYQQAVLNLAQARANRLEDTAALFQALGGGWWNRAMR